MSYKTLSWNVRGLPLPHHKFEVKESIFKWKLDIIFLKEVKINGTQFVSSLSNIWRDTTFSHMLHRQGRGLLLVWLHGSIVFFYKGEDPLHSYIKTLSFINGQPIGFCSVYAPNIAKELCELWEWMPKHG